MKRSAMPPRKKPLKAEKGLKKESNRRRLQRTARAAVVEQTHQRFGICQLYRLGGCFGGLEAHEIVKRSQLRDAHLNKDLTVSLCRFHNGWVEDHPRRARRLGVSIPSWAYSNWPDRALREAGRLRSEFMLKGDIEGSDPFWDGEVDL